ncbi:MAG: helical backbone metal receptor [Lautropia sp.]|nr:helical backbone metal receptor [Lautropia sp.]
MLPRVLASLMVAVAGQVSASQAKPAAPRRIVSLLPSLTESVCVLGACGQLVGVDRHSNWPASVRNLPRLGTHPQPSAEAIIALRPDLVLLSASHAHGPLAARLKRLGIQVLSLSPESYEDIGRVLAALAPALGVPADKATRLWDEIGQQVAQAAASMPAVARGLRTYVEVDPAPYVAGPRSFMGQLLTRLGLSNVVTAEVASGRAFVRLSREWVLQADPDLMMVSDPAEGGLSALRARPGWGRLRALKAGHVCLFSGEALDVLVRPGPRVAEGARLMRDCARRHVPADAAEPHQRNGEAPGTDMP